MGMNWKDVNIMSLFSSALRPEAGKQDSFADTTATNLIDAMSGVTALTHSGNAYGGDADMTNIRAGGKPAGMATGPNAKTATSGKVGQPTPVDILNNELAAQAAQFGQEAAAKIPVATLTADRLTTRNELAKTTTGSPLTNTRESNNPPIDPMEKSYMDIIGEGRSVVQVLPKGEFYKRTSKNMGQAVDPRTGETILYVDNPIKPQQNDDKVAQNAIATSGNNVQGGFDINKELAKTRNLKGDDLLDHVSTTLAAIDVQVANEFTRIRQQAAMESGYTAAQAALQRHIMLDETSGFTARHGGQPSGQTVQARQEVTRALAASQALERSLMAGDSKVAELTGAKNTLSRIEAKRGQREASREEKAEYGRATVTPVELTNYRYVYGTTGDDDSDRTTIASRRDKDPVMKELLGATTDNIQFLLMHPNPRVKDGAMKLVLAYEKTAPGSNIPADAVESPTTKMLKEIIAQPDKLIDLIPDKDRKNELKQQMRLAKSGKELAEIRSNILPDLLGRYVEGKTQMHMYNDMRAWKATTVTDPNSPLAKAIKKVSDTNPSAQAPILSVVDTFIQSKDTGPDGKPIAFNEKIRMLTEAIAGSTSAINRNLMLSNDAVDAMRIRMTNDAKLRAATAFVQSQGITTDERAAGMDYLYSRDFRRSAR